MKSYVKCFNELTENKLSEVGGKALSLIKISNLDGVRSANGFCITTSSYIETFKDSEELNQLLVKLSDVKVSDIDKISNISKDIRSLIKNSDISIEILNQLKYCLKKIGKSKSYAVRSSATAEDLPSASFAGQHDTYLNIIGLDNIIEHIKECWASLFTERAVIYRTLNKFEHEKVKLAVIVQEMIFADVSGVLFTADPVTSNRKMLSIDASFGLGEALVSGLVNSDNYSVLDGKIIKKDIKNKNIGIYRKENGGTKEVKISDDIKNKQAIDDNQILKLEKIARKLEKFYSSPQDIEWCILDNEIYILQSRAITTLYPLANVEDGVKRVLVSSGHMQMMTAPIKPLGMHFFKAIINNPPSQEIGGRLYLDMNNDLATPFSRLISKSLLKAIGDTLITDSVLKVLSNKKLIKSFSKGKDKVFRVENNSGALSIMIEGYKAYKKNDPTIISDLINKEEEDIKKMISELDALSGEDVFKYIYNDHDNRRAKIAKPPNAGALAAVMLSVNWFNKKIKKWLGEDNAADTIIMSLDNSVTSETGFCLMEVSDIIREYKEIIDYLKNPCDETFYEDISKLEGGKVVCKSIKDYLSKYGMRCSGDIDITVARWCEKPSELLPIILSNIENFEANSAKIKFDQGRMKSEKRIEELVSQVEKLPRGKKKSKQIRKVASLIRNYIGYREYPKFSYMKRYLAYKNAMLKEADVLLKKGVIKDIEDIYYLYFDELQGAVTGNDIDYNLITKRKNDYEKYEKLTPPRVMMSDGEIITSEYDTSKLPDNAIPGLAVSAGIIEGRARVIRSMKEAELSDGDILVVEFTDPSWTPAFVSIKGLITEVGGILTHGAIIAREYGLPAVVSVKDATKLIKDGQLIRLNGSEGYVEILSE